MLYFKKEFSEKYMDNNLKILNILKVYEGSMAKGKIDNTHKMRHSDAFVYFFRGCVEYVFSDVSFTASAGSVVFLPKSSSYRMRISEPSDYYVVDFEFESSEAVRRGAEFKKLAPGVKADFEKLLNKVGELSGVGRNRNAVAQTPEEKTAIANNRKLEAELMPIMMRVESTPGKRVYFTEREIEKCLVRPLARYAPVFLRDAIKIINKGGYKIPLDERYMKLYTNALSSFSTKRLRDSFEVRTKSSEYKIFPDIHRDKK